MGRGLWSSPSARIWNVSPRAWSPRARAKALRLEEAIHKMSGAVAHRLSLADRGVLMRGMQADIAMFDEDEIGDRATLERLTSFRWAHRTSGLTACASSGTERIRALRPVRLCGLTDRYHSV